MRVTKDWSDEDPVKMDRFILWSGPSTWGNLCNVQEENRDIAKPFVSNVYSVKLILRISQCYFFLIRKENSQGLLKSIKR